MKRSILLILTAALLGLGLLAGCGGGDDEGGVSKEDFAKEYKPINDEFVKAGEDLAKTLQGARGKKNAELAVAFRALSARVDKLQERLEALETPEELEPERKRVVAAMTVVSDDLEEISDAARLGQGEETRKQVQELLRHSVETRTARRALAREAGLPATSQGS